MNILVLVDVLLCTGGVVLLALAMVDRSEYRYTCNTLESLRRRFEHKPSHEKFGHICIAFEKAEKLHKRMHRNFAAGLIMLWLGTIAFLATPTSFAYSPWTAVAIGVAFMIAMPAIMTNVYTRMRNPMNHRQTAA